MGVFCQKSAVATGRGACFAIWPCCRGINSGLSRVVAPTPDSPPLKKHGGPWQRQQVASVPGISPAPLIGEAGVAGKHPPALVALLQAGPPPPPKGHARRAAAAALGPGEALPKASPAPGFGGAVLKHQEVVTVPLARTWAAASPLPVLAKRERTQPLASPCGYEERCRAWRLLTKFSLIKRALSSAPNPLPHCQSPSCLSFPTQTQPHSRDSHSATLNQLSSRWCRRHRRPWPAQCEVVLGGQQKLA